MMVLVTYPPVPGPMDAPGDLSARCGRELGVGNLVHQVSFCGQQDAEDGSVQIPAVMPAARVYSTRTAAGVRGFTLIEIMITLTIIGILSAIAVPSYFSYIQRANRADAKATLMDATQFMQRFYSLHNSYRTQRDGRTQVALPTSLQRSPKNGTPLYDISVESDDNSYTLRAVPRKKTDPCGTLTLNSVGVRGNDTRAVTGTERLSVETCWR